MKYVKGILKIIGILLIPTLFQAGVSLLYTFFSAFMASIHASATGNELDMATLVENIQGSVLANLALMVMIANLMVIFVFLLVELANKRKFTQTYQLKKFKGQQVPFVLAITVCGFIFSLAFSTVANLGSSDVDTMNSLQSLVTGNFFMSFLSVGIVAPIAEEFIFRGAIFRNLKRLSPIKVAIVIQAVIFSAYHMNIIQAVPTLILGLNAGFVLYYTGSMWAPIIIHMGNNLLSVILSNTLPMDWDISMPVAWVLLIVAPIALVICHLKFNRIRTIEPQPIVAGEVASDPMMIDQDEA